MDDWREIEIAPKNEAVLICESDCSIFVAIQQEGKVWDEKSQKEKDGWVWRPVRFQRDGYGHGWTLRPKMWKPVPFPPKHLWERKLAADVLEKQLAELRK